MEVKTFEVRDAGTFIPCLAIRLNPATEKDRYLLARAGYGKSAEEQGRYIVFGRLSLDGKFEYDNFKWGSRTMQAAHQHIRGNFSNLVSGSVIDVQFILGETSEPKKSESLPAEYSSSALRMARHMAVEKALNEIYVQDETKQ